ncbi:hypothetical protein FG125_19265, partial [Vibrio cholerae]|nr:hypothetical protein [Vibrio cholerae]
SNYAANAGKSGGEFFTPQHVSKLIAQLAMHGQTSVNKIYDPAAGSGSLLLQAKKHFDAHIIEDGFFGQELNHTTYNLSRLNMFLHNINYDKLNVQWGDNRNLLHFIYTKQSTTNLPIAPNTCLLDIPFVINDGLVVVLFVAVDIKHSHRCTKNAFATVFNLCYINNMRH